MVDPVVGTVVAKAVNAARSEGQDQITLGLLQSILGPPAKEFGEALGRTVAYRTRNFGRIVEKADARLQGKKRDGIVNIRVAYALLEEGSLCDDELMAEYFGGLLAASKSPDGRDDRAATWTRLVTGLSSFQIRAHYLFYRQLAALLHDEAPDTDLSFMRASIFLDSEEFAAALMPPVQGEEEGEEEEEEEEEEEDLEVILLHSINGLCRLGLLNERWFLAKRKTEDESPRKMKVSSTGLGIELYGWALGLPNLLPSDFASRAFQAEIPTEIPRLRSAYLDFSHVSKYPSLGDNFEKPFGSEPLEVD